MQPTPNMRPVILALFIACCVTAMPAKAQPPVKTGGGWAFTCKNGAPVYDGSGTAPDAGGSCRSSAGASSSPAQGQLLQGAFDAGVALNQWFARADQRARERRAAREAARIAAEVARRDQFVRDSIAAARAREETWRRLSSQFQFSTAPQLEMRLGAPAAEIGFRFDGDTEQRELSNPELMARNTTSCTFMASCGEKTVIPELGDPMVVDLRHLRRAAHLLRRTEYASAEERESLLDVATQIIEGGGPEFDVPADAPELPADAVSEVGAAVAERRTATAERMQRAEAMDTVSRRRDFLSDVVDLARNDQTLSAAERTQLLAELGRQLSAFDSALAQARLARERAEAGERQAISRQRSALYRVVRFQGREPAPTRPTRRAPRWSLASASELTAEMKGEVNVYAAEPLVDNPEPRLPPQVEIEVRRRLTPDVLYVTGPTGVIEVSTADEHRLKIGSDTRVAVNEVPLSTDAAETKQPVVLELIRGTLRWWSTVLDSDVEQARLMATLREMDPLDRQKVRDDLLRVFGGSKFRVRRRTYGGGVRGSDVEFFVSPGKPDIVRVNSGILVIELFGRNEEVVVIGGETATVSDSAVTVTRHSTAN